jgi:hypothetical protein
MTTTTEYHVISSNNLIGLIQSVNKRISENWQPIGGMVVESSHTQYGGESRYYQTMIKVDKPTKTGKIKT